jgi:hypothetical protein
VTRSPTAPDTYPEGKRFAFTIIDDTDVATLANVGPVYRLLEELGFRTTKTVWPLACPEGSPNYGSSQTLEEPEYLAFVLDLQRRGFEIAFHGATMESSERERTTRGLQSFSRLLHRSPRVHANHGHNRENLYWGAARFDDRLVRRVYVALSGIPEDHFLGHVEGSPYWWGDLCVAEIEYVRNLTFRTVNLLRINPSLPYHDPRRPLVRRWFSASDAEGVTEFNQLLCERNQVKLEQEGGLCIVATHFGKGFVREGTVDPRTSRLLTRLAARPGWYVPVGQLLDWLAGQRGEDQLPAGEWTRMQRRWLRDLLSRQARHWLRRRLTRRW